MNRVLITTLGDQLRQEMKSELQKPPQQEILQLPQIKNKHESFLQLDEDNPLYKKSLSEVAMNNLSRTAQLSLEGPLRKAEIEEQIRSQLQLPSEFPYLNRNLEKFVNKMVIDKDMKTQRKKHLLGQLKKLKTSTTVHDNLEFSTILEDSELTLKMKELVNIHGKMEQLQRRYFESKRSQEQIKTKIRNSMEQLRIDQQLQIDSYNPPSPEKMRQTTQAEIKTLLNDKADQRYEQRIADRHKQKIQSYWQELHIPRVANRWNTRIQSRYYKS